MKTITQTLKAEIVKPVDGDWDSLGETLRALRYPLHRVMNNTITDIEVAQRRGDRTHPRTISYQMVTENWKRERREAEERVNGKKRSYIMDDRIAELEPHSSVRLGVAGDVYTKWSKYNKGKWKGDSSLPSFRGRPPISIASSNKAIGLTAENGLVVLRFPLLGASAPKDRRRCAVSLAVEGGSDHAKLRWLLDNPSAIGGVKLSQRKCRTRDKKGPGKWKWFAFISYTHDVEGTDVGRVMAVHRSVHNFVTVSVSRSDESARDAWTEILDTGEEIVKHRRSFDARRRSIQRNMKRTPGSGARGRGRKRRFEAVTKLDDAHARFVDTKCKQVAAKVVRIAKDRGVKTVILEDWANPITPDVCDLGYAEYFVRSFPLAQCKAAIEWASKREGLEVHTVGGQYHSRCCPKCGHVHVDPQPSTFLCVECKLERPTDVIAAWNMLRNAGFGVPLEEAVAQEKKASRRLKGASK